MAVDPEGRLHHYGTNVDFWWKVSRAVGGFLGLAWLVWVQFLGAGVKSAFQDFIGVTEVVERLEFVEQFMPPPRVVDWNESAARQAGSCTYESCPYVLSGARTPYGEHCGRPTNVEPFLRTRDGQNIRIRYDNYTPVELTREVTEFTVPLVIPRYIPAGDYEFRTRVVYPDCAGRGEPIPRVSPWFPLQVTRP